MRLNLIKFGTVKSTNDIAINIIRSKKSNAGIIVSDNQTKGRGTMGNNGFPKRKFIYFNFFSIKKKYAKTR